MSKLATFPLKPDAARVRRAQDQFAEIIRTTRAERRRFRHTRIAREIESFAHGLISEKEFRDGLETLGCAAPEIDDHIDAFTQLRW